ncbi:MAG: hypothetical protein ISR85_06640 [Kiritimatiellales bacterium]|nr:hypothetical protein [Kiritimatiellota bacterium]MBL7012587.1 hypothetical protein [Kiritimatiellales bacterium]
MNHRIPSSFALLLLVAGGLLLAGAAGVYVDDRHGQVQPFGTGVEEALEEPIEESLTVGDVPLFRGLLVVQGMETVGSALSTCSFRCSPASCCAAALPLWRIPLRT